MILRFCLLFTFEIYLFYRYSATMTSERKSDKKTFIIVNFFIKICFDQLSQHHLKRRPDHRKLATSQTSELVGKAPKTCNSYPDAIFK